MRASLLASAIAQHVVMQPLFGSLNPGFEPVGGPPGWLDPDQHDPCRLHEEDAQVSIGTLGYLAEDRTIAGADLSWHQSKPCSEITPLGKASPVPIAATMALDAR